MAGSPITIRLRTPEKGRTRTLVEIEDNRTGQVLAKCNVGDDLAIETIADILSAKRLPMEAMALRKLAMDARHGTSH